MNKADITLLYEIQNILDLDIFTKNFGSEANLFGESFTVKYSSNFLKFFYFLSDSDKDKMEDFFLGIEAAKDSNVNLDTHDLCSSLSVIKVQS